MPALPELKEVVITPHPNGILELRLNTPQNLNAFGPEKYWELIKGMDYAKEDPNVKAVVVSATGRFFSAGAALTKDRMSSTGSKKNNAAIAYIDALIDFPKLIVCALQGPAYGITVTTLPLFDLVYASPEVTLTTPFSRIGISLEGVSSVLFPPLFGPSMTTRLLFLAETVPVSELAYSGVFAGILPKERLAEVVIEKIATQLEDLAPGSIVTSKSHVRSPEIRAMLHRVNEEEMNSVAGRISSQEHYDAVARFQRKKAERKAGKL